MLHTIRSLSDPLIELIRDDPVRPDIPKEFRVSEHSQVFVLLSDDDYALPQAVVCVAYKSSVPRCVVELATVDLDTSTVAVFYTIWSYTPGSGRRLISAVQQHLRTERQQIKTFVTLSPPTDMARSFHHRNGAQTLSVNLDTVNYIYSND